MVRAPCCEKMGLKKGPWTPEEDQILISYIQRHGHGNWRALPKQAEKIIQVVSSNEEMVQIFETYYYHDSSQDACSTTDREITFYGLLRCGKSCRLRWTNYLRPDIKRGNFSIEEEETIIKLHELLGNRWSAIAGRLPGRTDNEIKNVWHTHLKKRLKQNPPSMVERSESEIEVKGCPKESKPSKFTTHQDVKNSVYVPVSPHQSSSDFSSGTDQSTTTAETCAMATKEEQISETDENLCSEAVSADNTWMPDEFLPTTAVPQFQLPLSPSASYRDESMDFWFNLFIRADDLPELPEF